MTAVTAFRPAAAFPLDRGDDVLERKEAMYRRFRERPLPQEALPSKLPVLGLDVDRKEAGLTDEIHCIIAREPAEVGSVKHP
jgi:hypothetical protein